MTPTRAARLIAAVVRGYLLRLKVDRAGSRLLVTGKVRITRSYGRIYIGDRVSLESMKILVVGAPDRKASLTIGDRTFINEGSELHVGWQVTIGTDCAIAGHVMIRDRDSHRLGVAADTAPLAEALEP